MKVLHFKTPVLRMAFEHSGPKRGEPLILLHGWPDSPRTWDQVLPMLHEAGCHTLVPYLRGYGPSAFRDKLAGRRVQRTGQPVAFAQDIIHLADRLEVQRFHFIGHDWGARAGYALAALFPERIKSITAISVPFEPGKARAPELSQAQAYWYQWLLCTQPGEARFRQDPVAFGKAQWDAWSPAGWYQPGDFAEAAKSWQGSDFEEVVLHSYRSRWGHAPLDPIYSGLQTQLEETKTLNVPTLLVHGQEDRCVLPQTTDGAERYFTRPYSRVLLEGVGHFPQRESPKLVAAIILEHLRHNASAPPEKAPYVLEGSGTRLLLASTS
jgi:pimeloyl-ACP methyl ester carboxylesterase